MLRCFRQRIVSAMMVLIIIGPQAHAAGISEDIVPGTVIEEPTRAQWDAAIVPLYGWVTGVRGNVGVLGLTTSVSVSPGDILSNLGDFLDALDGYYMGSGHIRLRKVGFLYDAVHFRVSSIQQFGGQGSGTFEFSGGGSGPISGPDLSLSAAASVDSIVDVGFSYKMATFAGTYRAYETSTSHLDFLAGARITDVDLKVGVVADLAVAIQATLSIGPISRTVGATSGTQVNAAAQDGDGWVDPIVGIAGRTMLDGNWFMSGWAMVGGFGVNSRFLYDVTGVVGYEWKNGWSAHGGYRIADTDYSNGDFKWDVTMQGPIVGVSARF